MTARHRITLRPVTNADRDFLFRVFTDARGGALQHAGLSSPQIRQLLELQFHAQGSQYQARYPEADFDLIVNDDVTVGYLRVDRGADAFVLIDVALLSSHTGRGIGTDVIGALLREANEAGKPVTAHVEKRNPAVRLWERLGFEVVRDDGVYLEIAHRSQ